METPTEISPIKKKATPEQIAALIATLSKVSHIKSPHRGKSYEPYYREKDAVWFRDNVLKEIEAGRSVKVAVDHNRSIRTIRCMLTQARKYLFHHLDPDKRWYTLWKNTLTRTDMTVNREFYIFSPTLNMATSLRVVNTEDYMQDIMSYLTTIEGKEMGTHILEHKGISISDHDVIRFKDLLKEYTDTITYFVDINNIHIINVPTTNAT